MSTAAQILANQKNAQASTGPVSPAGKAASSQNAMKFGLTSQQIVLPFENVADFEAMRDSFINQLQPGTDLELIQVDDGSAAEWRLRRVERAITAWVAAEMKKHAGEDEALAYAAIMLSKEVRTFQKYAATYRRERELAWKKLETLQAARKLKEQAEAEANRLKAKEEKKLQIKAKWIAENPGQEWRDEYMYTNGRRIAL